MATARNRGYVRGLACRGRSSVGNAAGAEACKRVQCTQLGCGSTTPSTICSRTIGKMTVGEIDNHHLAMQGLCWRKLSWSFWRNIERLAYYILVRTGPAPAGAPQHPSYYSVLPFVLYKERSLYISSKSRRECIVVSCSRCDITSITCHQPGLPVV